MTSVLPGGPRLYDRVMVSDEIYYVSPTGGITPWIDPQASLKVVDPLDSAGNKKWDQSPWRQIVATIGPDEIRVQWRDPDGTYRPVAIEEHRMPTKLAIATSKLMAREENIKGFLQQTYPGIDTSGFKPYSSRGGIGLYVNDARVFFRNVVIEPLAPTATP